MTNQEHALGTAAEVDTFRLTLDTFMPEMIRRHPQTRQVLDRHGLRGCGGGEGPHETVGFFARAHGVNEQQLMGELHESIAMPADEKAMRAKLAEVTSLTDRIYRPFFIAGIAIVLTLGVVWGLILLWMIGIEQTFRAAGMLQINAHGHAMIFGWVGLFVMGFALQAVPRFWHVELPGARLAVGSFVAMVIGVVVRTIAMGLPGYAWAAPVALGAGILELAAIITASALLAEAFCRKEIKTEPYMVFVLAGLGWFVLQAGYGLWHVWMTMTAADMAQLTWQVSTYQAPLRDMQVHGLALFMILGVSIRILPPLWGVAPISHRRAWTGFAMLVAAVLGEIIFFVAFRWTDAHAMMLAVYACWILLAAGIVTIAWPWKFWRPTGIRDRTGKFIRAAYGWLALSLIMLLLLPVYQWAQGTPFSHAYYGAIRHAVTVGFISMMIVGVASRVVATLTGRDPHSLSPLWGPFILLNVGCFLRVSLQTLTDWTPVSYSLIGVSGSLELLGLGWWGIGLVLQMVTRPRVRKETCSAHMPHQAAGLAAVETCEVCENEADAAAHSACDCESTAAIAATQTLAEVLERHPQALDVFVKLGFEPLKNPITRRIMAGRVTVAQAAQAKGVALDELLMRLNEAV